MSFDRNRWKPRFPSNATMQVGILVVLAASVVIAQSVLFLRVRRLESQFSAFTSTLANAPQPRVTKKFADIDRTPTLGNKQAPIALVIYSDFECPFCRAFARDTLPKIKRQYVETGKAMLAFRHMPITAIHPRAFKAAEAAECAAQKGRFWEYHDALFSGSAPLEESVLVEQARATGLDPVEFAQCLNGAVRAKVQKDLESAKLLGISGTPALLFGFVEPPGIVTVSRIHTGALPVPAVQTIMDDLIAARQREAPR